MFDPDDYHTCPRQLDSALLILNEMSLDVVAAFGVRFLYTHYESNIRAVPEPIVNPL